jgi:UDP-glucose 4-epimerase
VYVGDVVNFLVAAMQRSGSGPAVYNVCTGESVSINQLASIIMFLTGRRVAVTKLPSRKGDIRISVGSPGHAARMLDVSAGYNLASGLKLLLASCGEDSAVEEPALEAIASKLRMAME